MPETIVIAGAGHAASQVVASLRQYNFEGKIVLVGEEPYLPYQRPPLSKSFLAGESDLAELYLRAPEFYQDAAVDVRLDTRIETIDRAAKSLRLSDGSELNYDKLALTTGSRVRRLPIAGADLSGIYYLRDIADVEQIQSHVKPGARAVIVGGGYIGLEVAAVCATRGIEVVVLEMESRVMNRVVDPVVSEFYQRRHQAEGVRIVTGVRVESFEGNSGLQRVICADGSSYEADFAVVGVGILPNSELAEEAGLAVDNGIVVDKYAATNDPDIVAAGDCTNHPSHFYEKQIRLESVQNAVDQAKVAAATLCGEEKEYASIPWFWSDQYDIKLQIVGLSQGHDETVVRGDPQSGAFAVFYLKEGRIIAVDAINKPQEFMLSKRLIPKGLQIPPDRLRDTEISMREMAST
jgi:3-phenylpropionate/trans-cinnamate dioxygenase ferredoxin reductase subunit